MTIFKTPPMIHHVDLRTKGGVFRLEFSGRGLYRIKFPEVEPLPESLREVFRIFKKYLSAKLDLTGLTPFQKKVYSILMKVPEGTTISYGDLAVRSGFPKAARAVGTAMRKNRLPLVIPCHRVVPARGGMGEYSALPGLRRTGKKWKRALLDYEHCLKGHSQLL
ncbi:MAG: Methylated-DNA--protein-cysteine methyltransferase, constitutive [Candidatus Omnitrophica bacterium ADurb.Bin292]|nr:MAG: Methylated-DNA--protein-cysteine methyltransferase, constitutive [Candidatus Omnitrophica bacterium ADurb.Bin292]